jgi:hypothetical protein
VGDRGGEKAIMEVGLGFGVLHGILPSVPPRGVAAAVLLKSATLGEVRPTWSLGMSNDMRPSVLRLSSGGGRRPLGLGERCRGVAGAGDLFTLSMFSNWARREDTGFYMHCQRTAPLLL